MDWMHNLRVVMLVLSALKSLAQLIQTIRDMFHKRQERVKAKRKPKRPNS